MIKASRKRRIATGAGVQVQEVNRLLNQFEQTQKVMKQFSKGGMAKNPLWYGNLEVHPDATLQIGSSERKVRAVRVSDREKEALWPRLVAMYPDFDDYQGRTTRNIPVMRLTPA